MSPCHEDFLRYKVHHISEYWKFKIVCKKAEGHNTKTKNARLELLPAVLRRTQVVLCTMLCRLANFQKMQPTFMVKVIPEYDDNIILRNVAKINQSTRDHIPEDLGLQ